MRSTRESKVSKFWKCYQELHIENGNCALLMSLIPGVHNEYTMVGVGSAHTKLTIAFGICSHARCFTIFRTTAPTYGAAAQELSPAIKLIVWI